MVKFLSLSRINLSLSRVTPVLVIQIIRNFLALIVELSNIPLKLTSDPVSNLSYKPKFSINLTLI